MPSTLLNLNSTTWAPQAAGQGVPSPGDLYQNAMKGLQGYGNAEQQVLQQSYHNALGMANQQLVSSGLAGTSISPSIKMGYMKQYQQALDSLGQQLQQQKLSAQSQFGFGAINARNSLTQSAIGLGQLGLAQQRMNLDQQQANDRSRASTPSYGFMESPGQNANVGSVQSPYLSAMMSPGPTSQFGYWQ